MPAPAVAGAAAAAAALYRLYKLYRQAKRLKKLRDAARLKKKIDAIKKAEELRKAKELAKKIRNAKRIKNGKKGCGQTCRPTKHSQNRHVSRKKYPTKSKYKKPQQLKKLRDRTLKSPDRAIDQGDKIRYEKDFGRVVGTNGETTNVVVKIKKTGKILTEFPK